MASRTQIIYSVCRWVQVKPTWWLRSYIWICILRRTSLTILPLLITSWWWLLPDWNHLLCRVWSIYRNLTQVGSYRNQQPPNSNGWLSLRFWMSRNQRTRATVSRTPTRRRLTTISPWRILWAWSQLRMPRKWFLTEWTRTKTRPCTRMMNSNEWNLPMSCEI